MKLYILFTLIISASFAHAKDLSHISVETSVANTTDFLSLRTLSLQYRNHRRDLSYPYDLEEDHNQDWGLRTNLMNGDSGFSRFEVSQLEAFVGYKKSPRWNFEMGLGTNQIKVKETNDTYSMITAYAQSQYFKDSFYWSAKLARSHSVELMRFPKSIEQDLNGKSISNDILWTPQKYRIRFVNRYEWLNDENEVLYQDIDMKYNLSFNRYWILVGVGAEYYINKKDMPGYWTPRNFFSFGPRFEINGPLSKKMEFYLAANLNRFRDADGVYGDGYYLNLGIQTDNRNNNHFKIGYERVQSRQSSNTWSMGRPYCNYNYFW